QIFFSGRQELEIERVAHAAPVDCPDAIADFQFQFGGERIRLDANDFNSFCHSIYFSRNVLPQVSRNNEWRTLGIGNDPQHTRGRQHDQAAQEMPFSSDGNKLRADVRSSSSIRKKSSSRASLSSTSSSSHCRNISASYSALSRAACAMYSSKTSSAA